MIKISLQEFFATGKFGPIELGMPRHQVLTSLGAPDEYGYLRPDDYQTSEVSFRGYLH